MVITFKEYLEKLNNYLRDNPEVADMIVVSSSDDEGNSFNPVISAPIKGMYEGGEFTSFTQFEDSELALNPINAVCIN